MTIAENPTAPRREPFPPLRHGEWHARVSSATLLVRPTSTVEPSRQFRERHPHDHRDPRRGHKAMSEAKLARKEAAKAAVACVESSRLTLPAASEVVQLPLFAMPEREAVPVEREGGGVRGAGAAEWVVGLRPEGGGDADHASSVYVTIGRAAPHSGQAAEFDCRHG